MLGFAGHFEHDLDEPSQKALLSASDHLSEAAFDQAPWLEWAPGPIGIADQLTDIVLGWPRCRASLLDAVALAIECAADGGVPHEDLVALLARVSSSSG